MKKIILVISSFILFSVSSELSFSQTDKNNLRILTGYKSLSLKGKFYTHNTHVYDFFLANSNIPGSAGTTTFERLHFFALGCGYRINFSRTYSLDLDAGFLFGKARSGHKNANDTRHDSDGAFVYSEIRLSYFSALGFQYHLNKNFYLGLETQLAGVSVESGWDRFSKDEKNDTKVEVITSFGPKAGYIIKRLSFETSLQMGKEVGFGFQVGMMF